MYSNTNKELISNLIHVLKNAYENDNYMRGGMLILSYPSIEAYEVSNFMHKSHEVCKKLGTEVKQYIQDNAKIIAMNKISGDSIIHAAVELKEYLEESGIEINLDDFSDANEKVFLSEEKHLLQNDTFRLLSMLSCVLMDLGILRESGK